MGFSLWNLFKVRTTVHAVQGFFFFELVKLRVSSAILLLPRIYLLILFLFFFLRVIFIFSFLASSFSGSKKVGLLLINSVLILNRKRFLAKHGLDDITSMGGGGGQVVGQPSNPLKAQIVGLLHAVQYLKPVVIIANGITILFELVLGGS